MPHSGKHQVCGVDDSGAGIVATGGTPSQRRALPGALPGDEVLASGDGLELVARPSPARRAEPLCPHVPDCGGCQVQHMSDAFYASWKSSQLQTSLLSKGLNIPTPDSAMLRMPIKSRRRAVLTAKVEAGQYRLGFHEYRSHAIVNIEDCAVLSPAITSAMGGLKEIARIVSGGGDCRLTVLDVDTGLDVLAETGRRQSRFAQVTELTRLAVKARVLRLTVDGDPRFMRAKPLISIAGIDVAPPPGAFVQASVEAESIMSDIAASAVSKAKAKRVADLFCGLGAFTFSIARKARVLAIDNNRAMVTALGEAARGASGLKPIDTKVRDLFLDPLSPRELDQFDGVVFDPPRAGAAAQAAALASSKVRTVVAVSCNPATLARDLRTLVDGGYRLVSVQAIDQFLFTPHLEAIAVLTR